MKKRSFIFVFGVFSLQIITWGIFCSDLLFIKPLFFVFCLLLFFGMFGLLLYQTNMFHETIGQLGDWIKHMLPALLLSFLIGAADLLLWYVLLQNFEYSLFWFVVCLCMLFTALTIVFAMGAAMTLLYREKNK